MPESLRRHCRRQWFGRRENQLAAGIADLLLMQGGEPRIRDDDIDFVQRAQAAQRLLAEFAGVGQKDDLLRLLHHFSLCLNQQQVLVVEVRSKIPATLRKRVLVWIVESIFSAAGPGARRNGDRAGRR